MPRNTSISMQLASQSTSFECSDFLRVFIGHQNFICYQCLQQRCHIHGRRVVERLRLFAINKVINWTDITSHSQKVAFRYYELLVALTKTVDEMETCKYFLQQFAFFGNNN